MAYTIPLINNDEKRKIIIKKRISFIYLILTIICMSLTITIPMVTIYRNKHNYTSSICTVVNATMVDQTGYCWVSLINNNTTIYQMSNQNCANTTCPGINEFIPCMVSNKNIELCYEYDGGLYTAVSIIFGLFTFIFLLGFLTSVSEKGMCLEE